MKPWWSWQTALTGNIDQGYRESVLRNDSSQAKSAIAVIAVLALGYSYVDYLSLGLNPGFYFLLATRILFTLGSLYLLQRLPKIRNVNHFDITILSWNLALILLVLLTHTRISSNIRDFAFIHYLLILSFYLILPNRFLFRMVPAFILTIADSLILVTQLSSLSQGSIITIISVLISINLLGIFSSIRLDIRSYNQYLIQKTLIAGRAQLKELATTDSLTSIPNRRSFLEMATIEYDRYQRYRKVFSIAILDLDKLKKINDTHGHPIGDQALQHLVTVIDSQKRSSDIIGRLAGDEFGMILPSTKTEDALEVIFRIKRILRTKPLRLSDDNTLDFSFSVGLTEVSDSDQSFEDVYTRADQALLSAKHEREDSIEVL